MHTCTWIHVYKDNLENTLQLVFLMRITGRWKLSNKWNSFCFAHVIQFTDPTEPAKKLQIPRKEWMDKKETSSHTYSCRWRKTLGEIPLLISCTVPSSHWIPLDQRCPELSTKKTITNISLSHVHYRHNHFYSSNYLAEFLCSARLSLSWNLFKIILFKIIFRILSTRTSYFVQVNFTSCIICRTLIDDRPCFIFIRLFYDISFHIIFRTLIIST